MDYRNLYPFQRAVFEDVKHKDEFGFLWQMGTGKTPTTCCIIDFKNKLEGRTMRTIIFSPIVTMYNWRSELLQWTDLKRHEIAVLDHYSTDRKIKEVKNPARKVFIVNYEALRSDKLSKALCEFRAEICVCDESQRIKNYASNQTRQVIKISYASRHRYILTGTPITNSAEDIWSQFLFLDRGKTFGNKKSVFKNRYMVNENADWCSSGAKAAFAKWVFLDHMKDDFTRRLESKTHRVKTEDVVDLPELTTVPVYYAPSKEQQTHIKNIKQSMITWLNNQEDNPLVVQNAISRLLRLNEILSGYMRLEDGSIHRFKENPALDGTMELIRDAYPHRVIVFCVFKENYKMLEEALTKENIPFCRITGEESARDKNAVSEIFRSHIVKEGEPRVCIANTHAAGLGMNLQGARYKIYYSMNFSMDDYEQSVYRNYRAGAIQMHDKQFDYHMLCEGELNEEVYKAVKSKQAFAESLVDIKKLIGG